MKDELICVFFSVAIWRCEVYDVDVKLLIFEIPLFICAQIEGLEGYSGRLCCGGYGCGAQSDLTFKAQ